MMRTKLIVFLFLVLHVLAAPLTQQDVEDFIKERQLVPDSATLKNYEEKNGQSFVTYSDQFSTFKFVIGQDEQGKPSVLFRHQMTQINFDNSSPGQVFMGSPAVFIEPPQMPMIPEPPKIQYNPFVGRPFNQNKFGYRKHGMPMRKGNMGNMPCRLNQEEIKTILKENLLIFRNADVTNVKKVGFEKGSGILLQIDLTNDGKNYRIEAGFIPRWKKLSVTKIEEIETQEQTLLSTPSMPVEEAPIQIPNPIAPLRETGAHFESLLQSFIEKLLVRKDKNDVVQTPTENKPALLGSEGEPERNLRTPSAERQKQGIIAENAEEQKPKAKPTNEDFQLLGEPEKQEHHFEDNSEDISELVTDVISKIKLKSK